MVIHHIPPPYPFSSTELWGKILQVVSSPDAQVSKIQVEQIFDVKFPEVSRSKGVVRYFAKQGRDWYFDLDVFEYSPTHYGFVFGGSDDYTYDENPEEPDGMCLDAHDVRKDIEKQGWKLLKNPFGPPPEFPQFMYFRGVKRAILRIGYRAVAGCVTSVSMFTDQDDMNDSNFDRTL